MDNKQGNCVTINVHVKCDKEHTSEQLYLGQDHKKEERESCVVLNVFVKCEDKK